MDRTRSLRVLLAAATVVAISCNASAPSAPAATPRRGGTVVLAWQQPDTLNPLYSTGAQTSALISRIAVEGLLATGRDGAPVPELAREVPTLTNGGLTILPDGGMEVRYALLPGVRWSDGAPLTSADVRFTFDVIMSDPKVATREGYDAITSLETPDPHTVVVRYGSLYPAYATRFTAILPKHHLESVADISRSDFGRAPLGTGPFRITEFVAGSHVTAERNVHYRVAGRPLLDKLVFRFVPSIEAAKAQLRAGEVQVALSVGETDAAELEGAGIALDSAPSPIVEALSFNLSDPRRPHAPHPVVGDVAMRRALSLATPKRSIVDALLLGRARPGSSELPIGWAAPAGVTQDRHDPAAAARALDEAGWRPGPDGVRVRDGVRASIRITGTTGNAVRERIQQVLVDAWRDIGVEARIGNVPPATLTGTWSSGGTRKRGDFDVVIAQLGLGSTGSTDPYGYLVQRHTCANIPSTTNNGAGANYERFCNMKVDDLLGRAARTLDPDQQRQLYRDVLEILNDHVVAIWLYDRTRINAFAPTLSGHSLNVWDQATWDAREWHYR